MWLLLLTLESIRRAPLSLHIYLLQRYYVRASIGLYQGAALDNLKSESKCQGLLYFLFIQEHACAAPHCHRNTQRYGAVYALRALHHSHGLSLLHLYNPLRTALIRDLSRIDDEDLPTRFRIILGRLPLCTRLLGVYSSCDGTALSLHEYVDSHNERYIRQSEGGASKT